MKDSKGHGSNGTGRRNVLDDPRVKALSAKVRASLADKGAQMEAARATMKAARATQKLARGHVSPVKAAKVRHGANVVLGEIDSTYHGSSK